MRNVDPKRLVHCSKHLSLILRHDPASAGITLDTQGWAPVPALLTAVGITAAELDQIVAENNKKRFEFNPDRTLLRASQGHSVDVDLGYQESVPPETLYHGTSGSFLPNIFDQGLLKMQRQHVHLSPDRETALVVARRRKRPVVIEVFAGKMSKCGHKFWLSTNGVWLTEHVPPAFVWFPMGS